MDSRNGDLVTVHYCPHCGDELPEGQSQALMTKFFEENGYCPHWPEEGIEQTF